MLSISYCVRFITVTMTRHNFINIFPTEHFSSVNFGMSYEKKISFLVIAEFEKKIKIGLGFFNMITYLDAKVQLLAHCKVSESK